MPQAIRLEDLIRDSEAVADASAANVAVSGVTADSREVAPGFVFAALAGARADGRAFIPQAIARGAVAVLVHSSAALPETLDVSVIRSNDPRRSLALMAARLFGAQPATMVAVTGTSGKTSVADFTRQIFASLGHRSASIGTLGVVKSDGLHYGSLTTPDPVSLAQTLAELAADGVTHAALEASSHGLDQRRLDGCKITAGAFTNLGRDHLDYHPTMEDYLAAKLRLFSTLLPSDGVAVVNLDDGYSADVMRRVRERGLRLMATGCGEAADVRIIRLAPDGFAQRVVVGCQGTQVDVSLPLVGAYQASNAAVAAGLAIASGAAPTEVLGALADLRGVKGRLEIVGAVRGAPVVIDYAHKPDALAAALDAVRPFASGRVICVFGCGGDRDRGKRPIMGQIAAEKADVAIVTDDNPRSEAPAVIRREVLAAAPGAQEIGDRGEAIAFAIREARTGDVVLVAGKGHETGQIVGNEVLPFSDHASVAEALGHAGGDE